jgi:TolB-like protein
LAVLPLENLSDDPSQDYFADGITEELITDLGQIGALRVISRTSVMTYKNVRKPMADIARELNVEAVVEGSVLCSGEHIRITAQLIRAPADQHIWAKSYEADFRDTLTLQRNVARDIAEQVRATVDRQEQTALEQSRPVIPEAYEAYLKGRLFGVSVGLRSSICSGSRHSIIASVPTFEHLRDQRSSDCSLGISVSLRQLSKCNLKFGLNRERYILIPKRHSWRLVSDDRNHAI